MRRFYALNAFLARQLGRVLSRGDVAVLGRHHVPEQGPFLLVANHESFLDPILIQGFCPRPLHSMAKSTQFGTPVLGIWMRHLLAYPVRRFQVDPQAVRLTLRRLQEGEGVGIYIEGERSWTGETLEPRRGALRILLKAGVPVVPCGISGAYEMMPRWSSGLRRHPLRITF
ncbi:MAG: lysophospholipid acyltransferase family protein, partial [Longimicrobiales bacterium]